MAEGEELFAALARGELPKQGFDHRGHVAAAMAALEGRDFFEALAVYAGGLRRATAAAGVPQKYNATLTLALMSMIAEAKAAHPEADADALIRLCPEIAGTARARARFSPDRLGGPVAREVALLPDLGAA